MSALDSFFTVLAAPDVLWRSRAQDDNYEDFVAMSQADINAQTDPTVRNVMQKNLDTYQAQNDGKALSISNGNSGEFAKGAVEGAKAYRDVLGDVAAAAVGVIPWQLWAIVIGFGSLYLFLRFGPPSRK